MKNLPFLIRREFWEHRSAFIVLPAFLTLFFLLLLFLVFTVSMNDVLEMALELEDIEVIIDEDTRIDGQLPSDNLIFMLSRLEGMTTQRRAEIFKNGLQALSLPFVATLWVVMFYYLLTCLYGERRDRSVLFWKSMPVSDAMTITSKLVTGLWLVPFSYMLGIVLLQLSLLLSLTFVTFSAEIPVIPVIWSSASIVDKWINYLEAIFFYSLWCLPFSGWLLAVSAFAKSLPLAWALGVPLGIMICERIFTGHTFIIDWMGSHVIPMGFFSFDHFSSSNLLTRFFNLEMFSAILVGASLVILAIWLRGKTDEI